MMAAPSSKQQLKKPNHLFIFFKTVFDCILTSSKDFFDTVKLENPMKTENSAKIGWCSTPQISKKYWKRNKTCSWWCLPEGKHYVFLNLDRKMQFKRKVYISECCHFLGAVTFDLGLQVLFPPLSNQEFRCEWRRLQLYIYSLTICWTKPNKNELNVRISLMTILS